LTSPLERMRDTAYKDLVVKFWSRLHELGYQATGGKAYTVVFGMPVIQLTTVGRQSGLPRTSMLTAPIHDGDTFVLVASNGGDHRHSAWYLNLVEHPDVEVTAGGQTRPMRARILSADEAAPLWPRVRATYQGYARYEQWTDRQIPLVILEPRPAP
jgi:deazaflavin-dependent oxidoreductase (nitroreductase family)